MYQRILTFLRHFLRFALMLYHFFILLLAKMYLANYVFLAIQYEVHIVVDMCRVASLPSILL